MSSLVFPCVPSGPGEPRHLDGRHDRIKMEAGSKERLPNIWFQAQQALELLNEGQCAMFANSIFAEVAAGRAAESTAAEDDYCHSRSHLL